MCHNKDPNGDLRALGDTMNQLDAYLSEQQGRRVRELESYNLRLRERLAGHSDLPPEPSAGLDNTVHAKALRVDRQALLSRLAEAEERIRELEEDLEAVLSSRSWKLMKAIGIAKR